MFTKIDIRKAFHKLRMAASSEDLTTMATRFGAFKWKVPPFGLTGGPASWQRFINDVLWEYLNKFCTAYLDDILIYSSNLREHKKHVRLVLAKLREFSIQADVDKCEFHVTETKYLGLIISTDGIKMDPAKVEAIQNWSTPTCVKDVRAFIGFCNFYRRFVLNFSRVASPLNALTKKDAPTLFGWTAECEKVFLELKQRVCEALILRHFDPNEQCFVETDSSNYVNAGVLSQPDGNGILHPVAYFSRRMSPAECNYEIYDKELLAIIRCFKEWKPELESTGLPVKVLTDHKRLEYFMTTKKLTPRQARWAEFLLEYNFIISYQSGKKNEKADALTRKPHERPIAEDDKRLEHQMQTLLPRKRFEHMVNLEPIEIGNSPNEDTTSAVEPAEPQERSTLPEEIQDANRADELCIRIREYLEAPNERVRPTTHLNSCRVSNGLLMKADRMWVPEGEDNQLRMRVIKEVHDQPAVGHLGVERTLNMIRRHYYWPAMHREVEQYLQNCHVCKRAKASRNAYNGLLQPLPVPERPWVDLTMDFVVGLPKSQGYDGKQYDAILMVVDRLSKERHYIPCTEEDNGTNAETTAAMFLRHVWCYHGLPISLTSDHGPQFASKMWNSLCKLLGIKAKLSTAWHPKTDGQSEIANQEMERYLCSYVNHFQDDWVERLPMAEFSSNANTSATTKVPLFPVSRGYIPRMSFDPSVDLTASSIRKRLANAKAKSIASHMQEVWDFTRAEMTKSQEAQVKAANRHRKLSPEYRVGDLVWLLTKNIHTERPSKKLDHKKISPYRITELVGSSYRLDLPASIRIHNVFYPSLLRAAAEDPLPGQHNNPPPPVVVSDEEEWEVDDILNAKRHGRRVLFRVKWKGYDENKQWYPSANFDNAPKIVEKFYRRHPTKPRATS